MVNVFETIGHAERAVAALLADGYHAGQIAIVETADEASGLGVALVDGAVHRCKSRPWQRDATEAAGKPGHGSVLCLRLFVDENLGD